jgi:hypothetical protein
VTAQVPKLAQETPESVWLDVPVPPPPRTSIITGQFDRGAHSTPAPVAHCARAELMLTKIISAETTMKT